MMARPVLEHAINNVLRQKTTKKVLAEKLRLQIYGPFRPGGRTQDPQAVGPTPDPSLVVSARTVVHIILRLGLESNGWLMVEILH